MSGPKGYGYRVISEEERQRREDAARLIRCAKLVSRIEGLLDIAARLGVSCEVPDCVKAGEAYSADEESLLLQTASVIRAGIDDERRRLRVCSMRAELAEMIRGSKYLAPDLTEDDYIAAAKDASESSNDESILTHALYLATQDVKRAEAEGTAHSAARSYASSVPKLSFEVSPAKRMNGEMDDSAISGTLSSVADAISNLRDDGNRQIARGKLECIAGLPDRSTAKGELLSLKNWVHWILDGESWAELAANEIARIDHVESELADKARIMSGSVSSKSAFAALKEAVSEALAEHERAEDARYVQDALQEALEALGFTIGEGFSTTDFGEVGVAAHPAVPGYGVRIQNNPKSSQILTRIVSYSESTPGQDAKAERITCPMVYSLADELRDHGVSMELTTEKAPGECRVARSTGLQFGQRSISAKKTAKAHERTM